MSKPTEHKTVQARILAYADLRRPVGYEGHEAILLRLSYEGRVGWIPRCGMSEKAGFVLRLRRAKVFCRRGLNRKERREHKEDFNRAIWQQVVAKSADRIIPRRLRENRLLASEHFCDSLSQNFHIV